MRKKLNSQKQKVYRCFDKRWEKFNKHNILSRFIMYWMDHPVEKILLNLSPENILDVGCGIGRTMSKFKKLGFRVSGIDNSRAGISFCERRGFVKNKEVFEMNAAKMNFKNQSFDVVFSEGLFEHFEDYEPLLGEMVRVSKKYILLIQPNFHSISGKILNLATEILKKENPKEIPYIMENYIESFKKYDCKLMLQKPAVLGAFIVLLFKKNKNLPSAEP